MTASTSITPPVSTSTIHSSSKRRREDDGPGQHEAKRQKSNQESDFKDQRRASKDRSSSPPSIYTSEVCTPLTEAGPYEQTWHAFDPENPYHKFLVANGMLVDGSDGFLYGMADIYDVPPSVLYEEKPIGPDGAKVLRPTTPVGLQDMRPRPGTIFCKPLPPSSSVLLSIENTDVDQEDSKWISPLPPSKSAPSTLSLEAEQKFLYLVANEVKAKRAADMEDNKASQFKTMMPETDITEESHPISSALVLMTEDMDVSALCKLAESLTAHSRLAEKCGDQQYARRLQLEADYVCRTAMQRLNPAPRRENPSRQTEVVRTSTLIEDSARSTDSRIATATSSNLMPCVKTSASPNPFNLDGQQQTSTEPVNMPSATALSPSDQMADGGIRDSTYITSPAATAESKAHDPAVPTLLPRADSERSKILAYVSSTTHEIYQLVEPTAVTGDCGNEVHAACKSARQPSDHYASLQPGRESRPAPQANASPKRYHVREGEATAGLTPLIAQKDLTASRVSIKAVSRGEIGSPSPPEQNMAFAQAHPSPAIFAPRRTQTHQDSPVRQINVGNAHDEPVALQKVATVDARSRSPSRIAKCAQPAPTPKRPFPQAEGSQSLQQPSPEVQIGPSRAGEAQRSAGFTGYAAKMQSAIQTRTKGGTAQGIQNSQNYEKWIGNKNSRVQPNIQEQDNAQMFLHPSVLETCSRATETAAPNSRRDSPRLGKATASSLPIPSPQTSRHDRRETAENIVDNPKANAQVPRQNLAPSRHRGTDAPTQRNFTNDISHATPDVKMTNQQTLSTPAEAPRLLRDLNPHPKDRSAVARAIRFIKTHPNLDEGFCLGVDHVRRVLNHAKQAGYFELEGHVFDNKLLRDMPDPYPTDDSLWAYVIRFAKSPAQIEKGWCNSRDWIQHILTKRLDGVGHLLLSAMKVNESPQYQDAILFAQRKENRGSPLTERDIPYIMQHLRRERDC